MVHLRHDFAHHLTTCSTPTTPTTPHQRIYIPLPESGARAYMTKLNLGDTPNTLTQADFNTIGDMTDGCSVSLHLHLRSRLRLRLRLRLRFSPVTRNGLPTCSLVINRHPPPHSPPPHPAYYHPLPTRHPPYKPPHAHAHTTHLPSSGVGPFGCGARGPDGTVARVPACQTVHGSGR